MSGLVSRVVVALVALPVVLGLVWLGGWWLFGLLAVQRSDSDGQRRRANIPTVSEQACPRDENDGSCNKPKP